jgi:hypothetical protein
MFRLNYTKDLATIIRSEFQLSPDATFNLKVVRGKHEHWQAAQIPPSQWMTVIRCRLAENPSLEILVDTRG